MKKLLGLLAWALIVAALAVPANALTIGSSSGIWTGVTLADPTQGYLVEINNNELRWGYGWDGTASTDKKSGLLFEGVNSSSSFNAGDPFNIGLLTYFNNPIWTGTEATGASLTIGLSLTDPLEILLFSFRFAIEETENDPGDVDDNITFPSSFASEAFLAGNTLYTLELLGFGDNADSLVDSFSSPEGGSNPINLWGKITSTPVPEPSTIMLFGLGLLGMGAVGRRKS